ALLRRLIGTLRIERDPHLATADLGIDIREAEERAGIVGFEKDHLAAVVAAAAHVAIERGVAAERAVQRQACDRAGAPREPQIESAQRLTVEADDGRDLYVEVDIPVVLLFAFGDAGKRRLDEAAAVVEVAAHSD